MLFTILKYTLYVFSFLGKYNFEELIKFRYSDRWLYQTFHQLFDLSDYSLTWLTSSHWECLIIHY